MELLDTKSSGQGKLEFDPELQWRSYLSGSPVYLDSRIRGQSAAVGKIARAVQAAELGLNDSGNRPKCSFLLLGPTGVGKTESARRFTEYLFGSRASLEMIFMNEYASETRLPEFLERTEKAIRRNAEGATLLFDEIEKAHGQLIDIFLSLLEEGQLSTLSGDRLSVSQFYLVLTSNLGSGDLVKMENAPFAMMERVAVDVASQSLRPELFARITERVVFRPLGLEAQNIIETLVNAKLKVLSVRKTAVSRPWTGPGVFASGWVQQIAGRSQIGPGSRSAVQPCFIGLGFERKDTSRGKILLRLHRRVPVFKVSLVIINQRMAVRRSGIPDLRFA